MEKYLCVDTTTLYRMTALYGQDNFVGGAHRLNTIICLQVSLPSQVLGIHGH